MSDSSSVRKRAVAPKENEKETPVKGQSTPSSGGFSILDIIRVLAGLLVLSSASSYFITGESLTWGYNLSWLNPSEIRQWIKGPLRLTEEQLLSFNGEDKTKPIYVALNGTIYDVSAGAKTYGPGGSYSFFAGKDAARAFITGCFADDLSADLRGVEEMYIPVPNPEEDSKMTKTQLKIRRERDIRLGKKKVSDGIEGWAKVFRGETGRPYFEVGTVKRPQGWLDNEPIKPLCESALASRPKREDLEK